MNAGGPSLGPDMSGTSWTASNCTNATTYNNAGSYFYQIYSTTAYTSSTGVLTCSFNVPLGWYIAVIHMVEPVGGAVGRRIFDILLNNIGLAYNVDIYASAGGSQKPFDRSFPVQITGDGTAQFTFPRHKNSAMIAGIELLPISTNTSSPGITLTRSICVSSGTPGNCQGLELFSYTLPDGSVHGPYVSFVGTQTESTGSMWQTTTLSAADPVPPPPPPARSVR